MSSSNGTEYYLKSMNGIKAFDDGSGTVIEDDTITVKTIDCEMITADSFFTDSFNLEVLNTTSIFSITGNLTVDCDLTTNGIIYMDTISSQTGATGTIGIIGDLQAIKLKSDFVEVANNISCLNCSADYYLNCITLQADYVNVSSLGNISTNEITSPLGNLTITSGKLTANGGIDTSGTITSGIVKTAIIQQPSLTSQIEFYKDTILPLYLAKFKFDNNAITSGTVNDTVSLFNNITTGTMEISKSLTTGILNIGTFGLTTSTINIGNLGEINIGTSLTSKTINIGGSFMSTGSVNLCSNLIFKASSIASSGVGDTISLFNNLTTGSLNFCNALTTGAVNMCSNLIFKASSIASSGVGNIISLFNNLTTGTLNIGNGLTTGILNIGSSITTGDIYIGNTTGTTAGALGDIIMGNGANNNNTGNNGRVIINKLCIGTSPILRNIRYGSVTNTAQTAVVSFSPAFPSGQVPFIIGSIQASNTGLVFSLVFSSVTVSSFRYTKTQTNGGGGGVGPVTEGFHYYAWSD